MRNGKKNFVLGGQMVGRKTFGLLTLTNCSELTDKNTKHCLILRVYINSIQKMVFCTIAHPRTREQSKHKERHFSNITTP